MLTSLKAILHTAAKSLGVERAAYAATIDAVWETVVGPDVAANSSPRGLRGDILWVDVEAGPGAHDFALQRMKVVASLNAQLGSAVVRDIRVRQRRGVVHRRPDQARRSPTEDAPALSAEELAQIDRVVAEITDEGLRAAARHAMVSQWQWRKRQSLRGGR